MATAYEFTVEGQYRSKNGKEGSIVNFGPIQIKLPKITYYPDGKEEIKNIDPDTGFVSRMFRNRIKKADTTRVVIHQMTNYILPPLLQKTGEGFSSVRLVYVSDPKEVEITEGDIQEMSKTPVNQMSESTLLQFIAVHDLVVNLTVFADMRSKRRAVQQAYKDKQAQIAIFNSPIKQEEDMMKPAAGVLVGEDEDEQMPEPVMSATDTLDAKLESEEQKNFFA